MSTMKHFIDCTPKEQLERWTNVVRVLKKLSPHARKKHWDMGTWGSLTHCGTIACAAGHCGLDPWFNRRGFKLNIPNFTKEELKEFHEYNDDIELGFDNSDEGMAAVNEFFGREGTENIFLNSNSRSVDKVIREVEDYIDYLKASFVTQKYETKYGVFSE